MNDEIILSLRNDNVNVRHHILSTKYAKVNIDLNGEVIFQNIHSTFNGKFAGVYSEDILVDTLDNHKIWLDIIEIRQDTLFISGFLMSFFQDDEIEIELHKLDVTSKRTDTFKSKRVYYKNTSKRFLGCSLESQYNFDFEIPIGPNENSVVKIYARFTGENSTKESLWQLPIDFANYARLSKLSNYSINKNHFLKFKDNSFYISKYNYLKMIKSEIPTLLRIFKRKENYYTSILAFRLIYLLMYPFYRNRRIWLFMDRQESADDNAEHLFKYAIAQNDGIEKYFTVLENSTDYSRLKSMKNLIPFYSIKQRIMYLFSEKII